MKKSIFKTVLPLVAVALIGVAIATSCKKEKEDSQWKTINIRHYNVPLGITNSRLKNDSLYVVNTYNEYIDLFGDGDLISDLPAINFQAKSLFVMCGYAPCIIDQIDELKKNTSNNYKLNVCLVEGDCLSIDSWNLFFTTDFKVKPENVVTYLNDKKI